MSPSDIERLFETQPGVAHAAVVGIADSIKGTIPVAFVVPKPGAALDEKAVRDYALANGPAYAHPRRVWIVEELPLAGTHKIDRRQLVNQALSRLSSSRSSSMAKRLINSPSS